MMNDKKLQPLAVSHCSRSTVYCPLFTMLCLLAAVGCGQKSPFTFVQVSGKVTYEDGSLIPAALTVTFHPIGESFAGGPHPRSASAFINKDDGCIGPVTCYRSGDGLPPGKYKVTLSTQDRAPLPASIVPAVYGNLQNTPLEVDTARQPFDLKVRKPSG